LSDRVEPNLMKMQVFRSMRYSKNSVILLPKTGW
jgi:hypothetical protein